MMNDVYKHNYSKPQMMRYDKLRSTNNVFLFV